MSTLRLMQIELNEFDPEFLLEWAQRLDLTHTLKFLSYQRSETWTDDLVEHQGLDPWVQWVNIHSGVPSSEHEIKRLGETRRQKTPQTWEHIAALGCTWGAWGVMNAPQATNDNCMVFMPDPWSFEERAFPERLNYLLALPRYMARNYLEPSKFIFVQEFLKFVRYFAPPTHWPVLARFTGEVLRLSITTGISLHSLTTMLDYLGALEFLRATKKQLPDYSVIFLNHIAHLQHQFWHNGRKEELHPEMQFGLKINNLIMGMLLNAVGPEDAVVVVNGLKQENVDGQGVYVYRQKNPDVVFKMLIGHSRFSVEQCMTNDAHLRFESTEDTLRAINQISSLQLDDGQPLFFTELLGDRHVFVQLVVESEIQEGTIFLAGTRQLAFYDLFETVCERTGAHIPNGDVFSHNIKLPAKFVNHELHSLVIDYFRAQCGEPVGQSGFK